MAVFPARSFWPVAAGRRHPAQGRDRVTFDREPGTGKSALITITKLKTRILRHHRHHRHSRNDVNGLDGDASCDANTEAAVCVTPTVTANPLKNKACDGCDDRDAKFPYPSGRPWTRPKSDDLPYEGPVVEVPDQGPDPLDEHGARRIAPQPTNGSTEPGLSQRRIRELADWYSDQGHQRYCEDKLDTAELDADLRLILREEVAFPEHVEIEFERVMQAVFAV